ncbi:hypothetical protein BCAH1134_C0612 (plasmid) [Bacillus cereus AH1134]|nr:hypothetical protein BCAH1134_C0612 [Bacillus cereus AH1134]
MILNGFQHVPLYFFKREHLLEECALLFSLFGKDKHILNRSTGL